IRRGCAAWFFLLLLTSTCAALGQSSVSAANPAERMAYRPADPKNASAFDHFYNLEYDQSVNDFSQVLQRHPDDPFALNHYMAAVLYHELYKLDLLNTGEYAHDNFIKASHESADAKFQAEFQDLIERAFKVEDARLSADPNDIDALYARGVTRAQFAVYTGMVQRAWISALRNAVGARHDEERVLELAPQTVQAKLVVGTHLYVLGSLPWTLRTAGGIFGLSGNKEKGLQYLKDCAAGPGETSVDAKILLVLFLRRERQFADSLAVARGLIASHPKNVLMALEEGNLLRELGRNDEAAAAYRKVYQAGRDGRYGDLHYEIAAYSLGDMLRDQKDYAGAAAAYEQVNQVPHASPDVLQESNLAAGEIYDRLQKRDLALKKYQAVIAQDGKSKFAETASLYLKDPYKGE
ncbi:MAG: tetratricopeptide repeat protein, partial [Terriglobales bacterium]